MATSISVGREIPKIQGQHSAAGKKKAASSAMLATDDGQRERQHAAHATLPEPDGGADAEGNRYAGGGHVAGRSNSLACAMGASAPAPFDTDQDVHRSSSDVAPKLTASIVRERVVQPRAMSRSNSASTPESRNMLVSSTVCRPG